MKTYRQKRDEAGFTLIELAISTIIVGVLLAAIAFPYSVWLEKRKLEETSKNVEQMAWAISAFRTANGHYPCPAPMDAPRNSTEYGYETDCTDKTVAVGSCSGAGDKYCRAVGERSNVPLDLDYDIDTPDVSVNPTVRIGAVPFRQLNMPEEFAYDAYGNRILYAVTENMAFSEDAAGDINVENHPKAGGINIVYKDDYATNSMQTRLDEAGSANFVILSHGADKVGGFNIDGNLSAQDCDESTSDGKNCDHIDGAGVNAEFYISEATDVAGDDHHDDVALFQLPLNAPLWARSTDEASDIYSIRSESNPNGQVGSDYLFNYYTDPAHSDYSSDAYEKTRLWVGGNIKVESIGATGGEVQALQICDREGKNCFKPEIIGGAGIECAGTDAMDGVFEGDANCLTNIVKYECPIDKATGTRKILQSINDGVIDCVLLPCKAETKETCNQSFSLPNAASGEVYKFSAGDVYKCRKGTFTCTDGTWTGGFNKKPCNCPPDIKTFTRSCAKDCTAGIITREKGWNCNTCEWFDRKVGDTCVCPPPPPPSCDACTPGTTGGKPCGDGYTGVTKKTTTTCSAFPTCTSTVVTPATCAPIPCTKEPACLCDDSCEDPDIKPPPCTGGSGPGCKGKGKGKGKG